jgi:hypothetical protein
MHKNYEVLKEHELNIIRDIQEKKLNDVKELQDQINFFRISCNEKDDTIKERERTIQDLQDQIRRMGFDQEKEASAKQVV